MNLTDLLQGCKDLNRNAQNELYLRYADKVMNVARRYTRDMAEAKDVVQNAFVKVFTNLDKYDDAKGNFQSWICKITVNEALLLKRKDKKYFYPSETEEVFDSSVDATVFSNLGIQEIHQLIDQLPDGYRTIFNLYVIEEFSHQEIADLLNISVVTSRTQLMRARKAIQKSLLQNEKKAV